MKRHGLHFSTRPRLFPARLLEARFVESKQQNLDGRFFPSQNLFPSNRNDARWQNWFSGLQTICLEVGRFEC